MRTTAVGDRYVLEELRAGDFSLGGEQSGHIVLPALGTTGDGIVTGLRLMTRMAQTGSSLAELASAMQTLPQVLINVEVADKATAAPAPSVADRGRRGGGRAGRHRSNPVASLRNRADGPGHGGGRRRGRRAPAGDECRGRGERRGLTRVRWKPWNPGAVRASD